MKGGINVTPDYIELTLPPGVIPIQGTEALATHLLLLFASPGPPNVTAEIVKIVHHLARTYPAFIPAPQMKIRAGIEVLDDLTNTIPADAQLLAWLKNAEGFENIADNFDIWHVGIYSHAGHFKGFLAAAAIPKKNG